MLFSEGGRQGEIEDTDYPEAQVRHPQYIFPPRCVLRNHREYFAIPVLSAIFEYYHQNLQCL